MRQKSGKSYRLFIKEEYWLNASGLPRLLLLNVIRVLSGQSYGDYTEEIPTGKWGSLGSSKGLRWGNLGPAKGLNIGETWVP